MKTLALSVFLSLVVACTAWANDGVYFTSGNFLVPVHETCVSVAKEVLTITIGKDSLATVDVWYELVNNSQPKTVTMAFEASSPYNDLSPLNRKGVHPRIKDFMVCMNGDTLPCRNAVVACSNRDGVHTVDFSPLDLSKWKGYGEVADSILPENDALYNAELDSVTSFAYAYYFDAPFKPGRNIVHHTYSYRMSYNVAQKFTIPYWLTPALRWANRQVDDFTLRIASKAPVDFCLKDSLFRSAPFSSVKGNTIYRLRDEYGVSMVFAHLSQGDTVVWHGQDFKPTDDMTIESPLWMQDVRMRKWQTADKVVLTADKKIYRYVADCGKDYFVMGQDYATVPMAGSRVVEYSAEKGQGWLFMDTCMASKVNIRTRPTTKSSVLCTIACQRLGDMAEAYQCLGLVAIRQGGAYKEWYKIKVGNKVGYVSKDLMLWNALNLN